MTKIDIFSGFLGAGKTTLIKKLLKEALADSQVVLIENEFGEIGIDGGFLKEAGIEIKEMNSGCICCSLVGDFGTSLKEVMETYHPERILIEPSGVGKLSDVVKAVQDANLGDDVVLNSAVAVVDASKCKMYIKNFGEFFINQIEHAGTIILSRTDVAGEEKIKKAVELIREHNNTAAIITTPISQLDGKSILNTIEGNADLQKIMMQELLEAKQEHHHDHHHEHGEGCTCGCGHDHGHDHNHGHDEECTCSHGHDHHHEHDEECTCGHDHEHHHSHGHDEECTCGHVHEDHHDHNHEHHHEHGETCTCGHDHEHSHEHDHHHDHEHHHGEGCTCGCDHDHEHHHEHDHGHQHDHHHHHADEVFTSWGMETPSVYSMEAIQSILKALEDEETYGFVLRAKGMVPAADGTWIYFDYVPGESDVREGRPDVTGKFCVIGSKLKEDALKELFA